LEKPKKRTKRERRVTGPEKKLGDGNVKAVKKKTRKSSGGGRGLNAP